ncbi:hypothetical protein [Actinoplanes sp. M2I2]|uniref:hypothetical protein n=1 Tax=Actinoplanes sp. M2I2 TaxID=1734444 RepID=UPI00201FCF74|nr:hypothetical protein [Actinoplanes sp. M2I2]
MRQRGWVNAALGVVVAAGILGAAVRFWPASEAGATVIAPPSRVVDPSVPEAKLLDSVLSVEGWRDFGNPVGFAYVPKSRPPGLTDLTPGNPPDLTGGSHRGSGNGALLDAYHLEVDGRRVMVAVEFSAGPTSTCADVAGLTAATCVRDDKPITPEPDDVALRHTTAYLTADSAAALTSAEAEAAKRFWATAPFVPVTEATWFTDLLVRAEAAVQK